MTLALKLDNWVKRGIAIGTLFVTCAALGFIVVSHFVINTLSDESIVVPRSTLISAASYFPQSPRLQSRLARVELAETMGEETELARAEEAALRAVRLSPWNSNNHLLLASVRNLQGELAATETAMRAAVKFAPHSSQARWQLANVLVRQDKSEEAVKEFQAAIAFDSSTSLLPGTLDIVWNISGGDLNKLSAVVGTQPKNRLLLAEYLLKQERPVEAVTVYKSIARESLLAAPTARTFLDALVTAGQMELAKDLWRHLVGVDKTSDGPTLYNGSFEHELVPSLSQFDWQIAHSEYATLSLATGVAHNGNRSLRLTLTGRDTMVLGREVRQVILVKPGTRYRLECFARTENLTTTEGIRVVVAEPSASAPLASSSPIATGSNDWQPYTLDFVAPTNSKVIVVSIKRTPRFSYDEPSKGSIWLDDFTLREAGQGK